MQNIHILNWRMLGGTVSHAISSYMLSVLWSSSTIPFSTEKSFLTGPEAVLGYQSLLNGLESDGIDAHVLNSRNVPFNELDKCFARCGKTIATISRDSTEIIMGCLLVFFSAALELQGRVQWR